MNAVVPIETKIEEIQEANSIKLAARARAIIRGEQPLMPGWRCLLLRRCDDRVCDLCQVPLSHRHAVRSPDDPEWKLEPDGIYNQVTFDVCARCADFLLGTPGAGLQREIEADREEAWYAAGWRETWRGNWQQERDGGRLIVYKHFGNTGSRDGIRLPDGWRFLVITGDHKWGDRVLYETHIEAGKACIEAVA